MNLVTNEEDTTLYQDQMKGLFPDPRTAPDDPERERLLRFFAGAHGTDESKEEELRNVTQAIYALPVGSPVDLNRTGASEYTEQELDLLAQKDEAGNFKYLVKMPDTTPDAGSRLAWMANNNLSHIVTGDISQGPSGLNFIPLATTNEYTNYLPKEETSAAGDVFNFLRGNITGGGPAGLKDLDDRLKTIGMTQTARTFFLRQTVQGAFQPGKSGKPLEETITLIPEVFTQYLPMGLNVLTDLVFHPGVENFFDAEIIGDANTKSDKIFDLWKKESYQFDSAAESISKKYSTDERTLSLNVIDELLKPVGFTERVGALFTADAPFVAIQGLVHAGRALRADAKVTAYMTNTYGGKTRLEALENMAEKGVTYEKMISDYLGGEINEKARLKISTLMDTADAFRITMPGTAAREKAFRPRIEEIGVDLAETTAERDAARASGRLADERTANNSIKKLHKERSAIESKILLPKYYRDLLGETSEQLIVASYTAQAAHQIWAKSGDVDSSAAMWGELLGVIGMAFPKTAGVFGAPKRGVSNLLRWGANKVSGEGSLNDFANANKTTKDAIRSIFKDGDDTGLARAFLAGAGQAVKIRRQLRKLSQETGVEIDEDFFSNSLVDIIAIEEVRALGDSLDANISATTMDNLRGPISSKIDSNNQLKLLVTRLSEATYKLADLKADGSMSKSNVESLDTFVTGLTDYVEQAQKTLADDTLYVNSLIKVQDDTQALLIKGGLPGASRASNSLETLDGTIENELNSIMTEYEGDIAANILDPVLAVEKRNAQIQAAFRKRHELLTEAASELDSAQGASRVASQVMASLMVTTKREAVNTHRILYNGLDEQFGDAQSNVAEFYETFKNIEDLAGADVQGTFSMGAVKLANMDIASKTKMGARILFNDGAQRGLDDFRKTIGDEQYDLISDLAGLEGMPAIKQWETMKAFLKDPKKALGESIPENFDEIFPEDTLEMLGEIGDDLQMLISPKEWRAVDSHMGAMYWKKKGEGASVTYGNLIEEWQRASNPEDAMAFKRGRDTGVVENMSKEFWDQYKAISRSYEVNVKDRLEVDPDFRRWFRGISENVQEKGKFVDPTTPIPDAVRKTQTKESPITWLDKILENTQKLADDDFPLDGQELYEAVEQRLGKASGAPWDEGLGRYVFVRGSKETVALQAILTSHLRGRLAKTAVGKQVIGDWSPGKQAVLGKKDPVLLEAPIDLKSAELESMFNIKSYTLDADGKLIEAGPLLNKEEVYSAIDLDALERNRTDLARLFEEAEAVKASTQRKAMKELSDQGITAQNDIDFIKQLAGTMGLSVGTSGIRASDMKAVSKNIYNLVVTNTPETFANDMLRIKNSLRKVVDPNLAPVDAELVVDDFIKRMVIQHIYTANVSSVGNVLLKSPSGENMLTKAMGLDGDGMRILIGATDPSGQTEKNLRAILGKGPAGGDVYDHLVTVSETMVRLQTKAAKGVSGKRPSMSLESILSRIYNLNREVVSTQWVATETLIRASRSSQGALFQAILTDPKISREILQIIESGVVPEYKKIPDWYMALAREVARQEAVNNIVIPPEGTAEVSPQIESPDPAQRQMIGLGYEPKSLR